MNDPGYDGSGRFLFRLGFVVLLMIGQASAVLADERILSFFSNIEIHRDGSMTVTEAIRVRSEQNQIKRGIYRDFPTTYSTTYGTLMVGFDVLGVQRGGQQEPYHIENRSNGKRVYIGDKDRILPPGQYQYTLRYRTDRQLGFFEDHDELYWNVTGNDWAFPIDQAGARVTLPDDVSTSFYGLEAYTGYQGDKGGDYQAQVEADGAAVFETTRALNPGEGLTIALNWPTGIISRPTKSEQFRYFLRDQAGLLFGGGGLLLVLFYYFLAWLRVGRDPEGGVVIPRFEPPAGLSPAAVRYIRRMGYDNQAFASAVINMAVKGFLTIEDDDGEYTLTRTPDSDDSKLSPGERKIVSKLFGGRDKTVLKKANHRSIGAAVRAHKQLLRNEYHKVYFKTNGWLLIPGVILSVVILFVTGIGMFPHAMETVFLSMWLAGWTFTIFTLIRQGQKFMAAIFGVFEIGAIIAFVSVSSPTFTILIVALILLNVVFYYLIKAPTDAGQKLLDEIEGLKMYMEVAEEERMNMLNPPEITPQHFEALLPYALALGVDQEWSERFAAHLAAHSAAPPEYQPAWYHGNRWGSFSRSGFSSSLGSSLSGAISASSTAPGSSSGVGGGGSSGGGGGGGGGGGW